MIGLVIAAALAAAQPPLAADGADLRIDVGLFSKRDTAQGAVSMKPGEVMVVTLQDSGGGRLTPVVASRGAPAGTEETATENTLRFVFQQSSIGLTLQVQNSYGQVVDYKAAMLVGGRRMPTSVCELQPGVQAFEMWMDPITSLEFTDFRFVESSGMMTCD